MARFHPVMLETSTNMDLVQGATTFVVVFLAVVVVLVGVGLVMLFRRREGARSSSSAGLVDLEIRANAALVRADQALSDADDELGFAIAQFGDAATADFAAAIADARLKVQHGFAAKKTLDDPYPESPQDQRALVLQMLALAETAQKSLEAQARDFSSLRSAEVNAPASIESLRGRIAAASDRLGTATATLDRLRSTFAPMLTASYDSAVAGATTALADATKSTDAAAAAVSPAGVNAVAGQLAAAEKSLREATTLLDGVDGAATRIDAAATALDALVVTSNADLVEARAQREAAPDADTGAAIIDAIDEVERELASISSTGRLNPLASLDALGAAIAGLDTALASARNQTQRLEHARTALAGTLVSARSQLEVVRNYAATNRVGADAKARIAEAERQLTLAEAEADPVEALDAARRSVTSARDADALARYAAMKRR